MSWTLVTGGATRLGAEICQTLAKSGHNILVHYRTSVQDAEVVVKKCREQNVSSKMIFGDFSTQEKISEFIKDVPNVKNLINNVGNILIKSSIDTTIEEYVDLMSVNLFAPIQITGAFLPGIKESSGSIINIGVAGAGNIRADLKYSAYSMSKLALLHYTKTLAKELAPQNVRVNMVSPGELENSVTLKNSKIPMMRAGSLKEVARVVDFLLKDESGYITGQNIEVAGGLAL